MAGIQQEGVSIVITLECANAIKNLVEKEHRTRLQLRGMNNLFKVLRSKDEKISELNETVENLRGEMKRTELQMSRLLRCGSRQVSTIGDNSEPRQPSSINSTAGLMNSFGGGQKCIVEDRGIFKSVEHSDLEQDGAGCSMSNSFILQEQPSIKGDPKRPHLPSSHISPTCRLPSVQCTELPMECTEFQSVTTSCRKHVTSSSTPELNITPASIQPGTVTGSPRPRSPEMSKDLISLMSQNERLKKVMRDILKYKGLTLSDYLTREEYEDIIKQLKMELSANKSSYERLKSVMLQLKSNDTNNLAKTCAQLQESNAQLQKSLAIKQTMLQSYTGAFEKLKKEREELQKQPQSQQAFEQLTAEVQRLRQIDNKCREHAELLEAENQRQKEQLAVLKEELDHPQNTLRQLKQKISSQREMIKRLTQESQKYNNELRNYKKKNREEIECVPAPLMTSFAQSISQDFYHTRHPDIGIDGDEPDSIAPVHEEQCIRLICKRCERSFEHSERRKYDEHMLKCVD